MLEPFVSCIEDLAVHVHVVLIRKRKYDIPFFCEHIAPLIPASFLSAELQKINDEWKLQVSAIFTVGGFNTPAKVTSADTAATSHTNASH